MINLNLINNYFIHASIGGITGPSGGRFTPNPTPASITDRFTSGFSAIIGLLTILAALYFMIQILLAAYTILGSGGQSAKLDEGRNKITYAVIGLAVVVASYAIVGLVSNLFGINVFTPFSSGIFS